jgi:aerobic-type carbon monoxide dehydrogenase small subunit (CoxS/CutS family)
MALEVVFSATVNRVPTRRLVAANRSLLDFLREDLGLTGSKHGCDVGDCGACTVQINGEPRLACITLTVECEGSEITTIEAIGEGHPGGIHPIQRCLDKHVASQCGYCTPGIVMALEACLRDGPADEAILKNTLGSNICRCTGYTKILAAAKEASQEKA